MDHEINWNIVEKEAFSIVHNIRHFHHFLTGSKFMIRCDNRVVGYVKDKSKPRNKKLLGWCLELSDYDYSIQHIPSINNNIADCLSRLCIASIDLPCELSSQDFIHEQQLDDECSAAKHYLDTGKKGFDVTTLGNLKRHRKFLHIVGGVLHWKNKIVVPKGLRNSILYLCHDHPMSGHYASDRTYQRFNSKYFWPGAATDVSTYVKACQKCNEFNPPSKYIKAPLQPIETSDRFERVCYDLAGPFFPKTARGNAYALIVVDHFSHWPEFIALPDITAPTIATALFDNWCCRYGTPERFHSDGANNVHGEVVKELCKHFGMKKTKSSRLHPQGDGMSEIFVRQLKSCVQKQVESNGSDWDLYLQTTAFAIRTNIANNSKVSPAELVFGDKLIQPLDRIVENDSPKTWNQKRGAAFAKQLQSRIKSSVKLVKKS